MSNEIRDLLESVKEGTVSVEDALKEIKLQPYEDLGYAKPDLHRKKLQGASEVIYGAGKA